MKSCRRITYLLSKQQDTQLNIPEQWLLHSHLLICPKCRRYGKQLDMVQQQIKKVWPSSEES